MYIFNICRQMGKRLNWTIDEASELLLLPLYICFEVLRESIDYIHQKSVPTVFSFKMFYFFFMIWSSFVRYRTVKMHIKHLPEIARCKWHVSYFQINWINIIKQFHEQRSHEICEFHVIYIKRIELLTFSPAISLNQTFFTFYEFDTLPLWFQQSTLTWLRFSKLYV